MNLIWHLIKKDLRALRFWLVLWVAACGTHLVLRLIQLKSGDAALPLNFQSTGRPDHLALYVLMLLIAPQIVQLDPPVSGRAFWKTLPIARWRLLVGKVLLLLAFFVVLPAACEVAYFAAAGFGEYTWAAVSIWAWRALPPVALVLGASVLSRDLRITALIVAAAAILLPVGGLNFLVAGWRPEAMRFAIPLSVVSAAVIGVALLVWQYLANGRFAWAIIAVIVGFGWWNKPTALAHAAMAANYRIPAAQPKRVEESIPMPEGMRVEISPLPPGKYETNVSNNNETKWKGTSFPILLKIVGLPSETEIERGWLEGARLTVDGTSFTPKSSSSYLSIENRRRTNQSNAFIRAGDDGKISIAAGMFDLEDIEWKSKPASLDGTLKLRLIKNRLLKKYPVAPGTLWSSKLDSLTMKGPTKNAKTFSVESRLSTVDIPEVTLASQPPLPLGSTIVFQFIRKDAKRQPPFGNLSNPVGGTLEWSGSGSSYSSGSFMEGPPSRYPGSQRNGNRLDLTRRVREYPSTSGIQLNQNGNSHDPLIAKEREAALFRDPDDWEIQALDRSSAGTIEVPIHFDNINPPESQWVNAKDKEIESLGETLDGIVLKKAPAPADVEDYLRRLCLAVRVTSGSYIEHHENTILVKLADVGSENLPALIRWAKLNTPPLQDWENIRYNSDSGWKSPARGEPAHNYDRQSTTLHTFLMHVINDLARDQDKDLMLAEHSPALDFLPAIAEHGWNKEAVPVMCQRAAGEPLPSKWIEFLLASDSPEVNGAIVEQCKLGGITLATLERARQREGFPALEAVSALWHTASERVIRPIQLIHIFALLCKLGGADAPGDLAIVLADDDSNRGTSYKNENDDLRGEMARILSWRSDCPPTAEAARKWLNVNAANMRFNNATGRYELAKSKP